MGHSHNHLKVEDKRHTTIYKRLGVALGLTIAFVFLEGVAGLWANSLALLTDAAHNLTDVIALALSWYALRLSQKPSDASNTFGYHRVGILIALLNSTTLILIALGVFYEAYRRFVTPAIVNAPVLIGVAVLAFVVNASTALLIRHGSEKDLNLRSAFVHLMGDTLSTFGAIIAGIGIALTNLQILDPLASVLIGGLIVWNAWGIVRESVDILLESTPRDIDIEEVVNEILRLPGVDGVHDVHVWSITQKMRILSAHVLTEDVPLSVGAQIQKTINDLLWDRFDIYHATLQLECANCDPLLLYCQMKE